MISPNQTGKCPHCKIVNRFEKATNAKYDTDIEPFFIYNQSNKSFVELSRCTNCSKIVICFEKQMIFPSSPKRDSAPKEVPTEIANDFNEACLVEHISRKASAALARRCLQNLLHNQGIKKKDLNAEIDEVITKLPSHLSKAIDAIRNIGNFATHPTKYTNSGEIVDVENEETEWTLNVLEQLFDFYYVQPAITEAKKNALNTKLKALGKPLMK